MPQPPDYWPLFEELMAFVSRPEHRGEIEAGRAEYRRHTGEVFEEDRSYDARAHAFLDWFIFDRALAPFAEPPARAFLRSRPLDAVREMEFRVLARTVHGVFEVRHRSETALSLVNLLTDAPYEARAAKTEGLNRGDLFEGRLVPFQGERHLSPAFVFHPPEVRDALARELRRQSREGGALPIQEMIFLMSRMGIRAEHYRNIKIEAIYDFSRPPPKVDIGPERAPAGTALTGRTKAG